MRRMVYADEAASRNLFSVLPGTTQKAKSGTRESVHPASDKTRSMNADL
jgi:hypothetical protein